MRPVKLALLRNVKLLLIPQRLRRPALKEDKLTITETVN